MSTFLQKFNAKLGAWLRAAAEKLEGQASAQEALNSAPSPASFPAGGPPAHWLERVRQGAPQLLESIPSVAGEIPPPATPRPRPLPLTPPPSTERPSSAAQSRRAPPPIAWTTSTRPSPQPSQPVLNTPTPRMEWAPNYPASNRTSPAADSRYSTLPSPSTKPAASFPPALKLEKSSPLPANNPQPPKQRTPAARFAPGWVSFTTRSEEREQSPVYAATQSPKITTKATPPVAPAVKIAEPSKYPPTRFTRQTNEVGLTFRSENNQRVTELRHEPRANLPQLSSAATSHSPAYPDLSRSAHATVNPSTKAETKDEQSRWADFASSPVEDVRDHLALWQEQQQHQRRLELEQRGLSWTE